MIVARILIFVRATDEMGIDNKSIAEANLSKFFDEVFPGTRKGHLIYDHIRNMLFSAFVTCCN